MHDKMWSLHDAKNCFSAVVDAAMQGQPQWVTRRGKPVSVVLSVADYERLSQIEKSVSPGFGQLLLDMPQDDHEFERVAFDARDVDF